MTKPTGVDAGSPSAEPQYRATASAGFAARFRSPALGLLAALITLTAACVADRPLPPTEGNPAPSYSAPDLQGDSVSLESLRGSPVVLNVWATWCPPCRAELPSLQALQEDFADQGLRVVAVSVDARAAAPDVRRFVEEQGLRMLVLHDPEDRITQSFRLTGVPHTFLIDREGTIVRRWVGEIDAASDEVRGPVRRVLGQAGS